MHKRRTWVMILASVGVLVLALVLVLQYYGILPKRTYSSQHFGIDVVYSSQDYNHNGVDDYTDFLLGAKQDAENHPTYDGRYCAGGYPPEDIGVCTDVVWRAFRQAGYSLRDMVDQDVRQYPDRYPDIQYRDANIDFRRVKNLWAFFQAYALELTCDITDIDQWQPGDIVIFNGGKHIGVVSDLRNRSGQPYILHNAGQFRREEDYLGRSPVEAHFRFDASCVPQEVLVAWDGV